MTETETPTKIIYVSVANIKVHLPHAKWTVMLDCLAARLAGDGYGGYRCLFSWHSLPTDGVQSACWNLEITDDPDVISALKFELAKIVRAHGGHDIYWAGVQEAKINVLDKP